MSAPTMLDIGDLVPGDVLQVVSGTRRISCTVEDAAQDSVDLVCNGDWSFQGGSRFTLSRLQFARSAWAAAERVSVTGQEGGAA